MERSFIVFSKGSWCCSSINKPFEADGVTVLSNEVHGSVTTVRNTVIVSSSSVTPWSVGRCNVATVAALFCAVHGPQKPCQGCPLS